MILKIYENFVKNWILWDDFVVSAYGILSFTVYFYYWENN